MTPEQLRERRQKLAIAVERHGNVAAVAKKFDVTRQLVRKACREFGVRLEAKGKKRKAVSKSEVLADLRCGKTPEDVAKHHEVPTGKIAKIQAAAIAGKPSRGKR